MPKYPSQIDTSSSLPIAVDNLTPVQGSIFNKLRDAVIAIEQELGVKPSASYSTVKARLDNLEGIIGNLEIIKLDGDLGGTLNIPKVIGIQGFPVSNATPNLSDVLVWNGIAWTPAAQSGGGGGGGGAPSGPAGGDLSGIYPNPTVANNVITFAKMQTIATNSLLGRDTAGTGNIENIGLNSTLSMDGGGNLQRAAISGDITIAAGSNTASITAGTIVNADINSSAGINFSKLENITTDSLIGRDSSGSGVLETITLNNTLVMNGSQVLGRAAISGDITIGAGSNSATVTDLTITSEQQGSILYFNGVNWVQLSPSTDGYVLTTHSTNSNPTWSAIGYSGVSSIITETSTTLILNSSHRNAYIIFTNAAGCTVTVNTGVFSSKDVCYLHQSGVAQVIVSPGGGMTVNKPSSFGRKTSELESTACLFFRSDSIADMSGSLGAP